VFQPDRVAAAETTVVTSPFVSFFVTSAQAGAALIGLLFVAVSLAPEKIVTREAAPERRAMALGTFTALANAFFVSMFALVPEQNLGYALVLVGVGAFLSTVSGLPDVLRQRLKVAGRNNRRLPIAAAAVAYGLELWQGVVLLGNPQQSSSLYTVAFIIISVYVLGLWRAWQLIDGQAKLLPRTGAPSDSGPVPEQPSETHGS
jgi:uncharacterized membrane protein